MNWPARIAAVGGAALCAAALAGAALAQTPLAPVVPDPQQVSLIDQVNELQNELQRATAQNEQLQHQLAESQAEVARLQKLAGQGGPDKPAPAGGGTLDAQMAAGAAGSPPPPPPPPADAAGAFKQAYALVQQSDFPGAEAAFRDFLAAHPKDALGPQAHYWLGQSLLAQNKSADAAEQFLGVVKSSPKSSKAPDAYLSLGVAFKQMGQGAQACTVWRDVPVKFPAASAAVKAKAAQRAKTCPP